MLKYVIGFYLLFFFSKTLFAQQPFDYFPIGTSWMYSYAYITYGGYTELHVIEDTVIQGKTCRKVGLKGAWQSYTPWYFSSNCCFYFYQDGSKVFYWKNGAFRRLYDFSLGAGEYTLFETEEGDSIYQKIDSVGVLETNGITRRVQYVNEVHDCCLYSDTCGNMCKAYFGSTLMEGIGGSGYFIPTTLYHVIDQEAQDLTCFKYSNDSTPSWTASEFVFCDVDILLSRKDLKRPNENKPRIWQADRTLYVETPDGKPLALEIYDMNGRKRLEKTVEGRGPQTISLTDFPSGGYIVRETTHYTHAVRIWVE